MSLAEELLADLEGEELEEDDVDVKDEPMDDENEDDDIDEVTEDDPIEKLDTTGMDRVGAVARLIQSKEYKNTMKLVNEALERKVGDYKILGPIEADPEYKLVVDVNQLAVEIDNEVAVIHKFIRDKYNKRFPELESLVPNAIEYMMAVKEMGNDIATKAQNRDILGQYLAPSTVIVVSVTATTSQGESLSDEQLDAIDEGIDMALALTDAKSKLFQYVEQRMSFIAPNLTALVGSGCAAMLMGKAGGLGNLAKMPSCNIGVLGATKKTLTGFSSTSVLPHTGILYYSPLVQRLPPDLRRKATRQLQGKVALVARVDACHSAPDGAAGHKFADEISDKFQKWLEPPPPKAIKPLPRPIDPSSKKRGGKRARTLKDRLGRTDLRRRLNRMNFAELGEDITQAEIGFSMGQLKGRGAAASSLRMAKADTKTKARMSKALQKRIARANQTPMNMMKSSNQASISMSGGAMTNKGKMTAGTASSVSFTPVQGLEIVNPTIKNDAVRQDGKYFGANASFVKVKTELDPTKKGLMMPPPPKALAK